MKTSLVIDDKVFKDAKTESEQTGKTISQIISEWALVGKEHMKSLKSDKKKKKFQPLSLGKPKLDLSNRKNWMEILDEET